MLAELDALARHVTVALGPFRWGSARGGCRGWVICYGVVCAVIWSLAVLPAQGFGRDNVVRFLISADTWWRFARSNGGTRSGATSGDWAPWDGAGIVVGYFRLQPRETPRRLAGDDHVVFLLAMTGRCHFFRKWLRRHATEEDALPAPPGVHRRVRALVGGFRHEWWRTRRGPVAALYFIALGAAEVRAFIGNLGLVPSCW